MAATARHAGPTSAGAISLPRAYTQLLITVVIWGGYFVVAKKAVDEASPLALATARYALGTVLLGALAATCGPFPKPNAKEWLVLGGMGVTSVIGFNVLSFVGFRYAPASDGALILPTIPTLFTLPLAALLFREQFGRMQFGGLLLLLLGEFFVFRAEVFSGDIGGERLAGISMFVTAAALWGMYTICARFLGGRLSPIHATFYAVAIGTVLLLPFGGIPLWDLASEGPSNGMIAAIIYLGFLQTVVGLIWWFEGVQAIGAGRAAVMNTLVPVVALFLAAVFLDDVPSPERVFGAILVVGGVAFAAGLRRSPAIPLSD